MKGFLTSEQGAVTVDWVVLTAGLVGLGLATMAVVSAGTQDVSNDVEAELSNSTIFTSFDQRNYSAYYRSMLILEAATPGGWFRYGVDATFASHVANATAESDTDLLSTIAHRESIRDVYESDIADFSALPATGNTAADIASSLGGSWNATQIQAHADQKYGGDLDVYVATQIAWRERWLAYSDLQMQIADERGLTY